jgi:hypothetical protein
LPDLQLSIARRPVEKAQKSLQLEHHKTSIHEPAILNRSAQPMDANDHHEHQDTVYFGAVT